MSAEIARALNTLARAATFAPSGDNTQPWRFEIDACAGRITLRLDESRDRSPMNGGNRMSRIACGAALENMHRTARRHGWRVFEVPASEPHAWTLELSRVALTHADDAALEDRTTNRRMYDGRAISGTTLAALRNATAGDHEEVRTVWLDSKDSLKGFAKLEGAAFERMYALKEIRKAIADNIRFDAPPNARVEYGMPSGALGLNGVQLAASRLIAGLPDWLLRTSGMLKAISAHAKQQIHSSSALCVVLAKDYEDATDVCVGKALQRAWLALTEEGLSAQPMMAFAVVENMLVSGDEALLRKLGVESVEAILDRWTGLLPQAASLRPAFVLRVGYAPAPLARSGRQPAPALTSHAVRETVWSNAP
ncbi:MAG: hypothetical protein KIS92_17430 [Planctomycetota bacterium]|nr:hypothetical protein [Planctomycetota bacterium]